MAICLIIVFASPAHAYLDPGTGSLIFQGLIAGVLALGVSIGIYWQRFKDFMGRFKKKDGN